MADEPAVANDVRLVNDLVALKVISIDADRLATMLHPENCDLLDLTELENGKLRNRFVLLEEVAKMYQIVRFNAVFLEGGIPVFHRLKSRPNT